MKPFQLIFIGGFVVVIIVAVFVFANSGQKSASEIANSAPVVIWGTLPSSYFVSLTQQLSLDKKATINIDYEQKDPSTLQQDLLEALADGTGPDALIVTQSTLMTNLDRLTIVPYTSYSQRLYEDTFVPEGNLFATHTGYAAIPFLIDPLVMYYNKDTLIAANIPLPPTYWDEVISLAPKVSDIDTSGNIQKSVIALGTYGNIENAKSIISTLLLQSGDSITTYAYDSQLQKDNFQVVLAATNGNSTAPGESALNFYTQFSDPVKTTYSWNGSISSSTDAFLAGNSALYLGLASEEQNLQAKNPNLNFDVTNIPQSRTSGKKITFGNLYGISVLKSSKNQNNAFAQAYLLSSAAVQGDLSTITNLPPVRLDLLQAGSPKGDMSIFYTAALQSKGWLEYDPKQDDTIFQNMIDSITSGRAIASSALNSADQQMFSLIQQ